LPAGRGGAGRGAAVPHRGAEHALPAHPAEGRRGADRARFRAGAGPGPHRRPPGHLAVRGARGVRRYGRASPVGRRGPGQPAPAAGRRRVGAGGHDPRLPVMQGYWNQPEATAAVLAWGDTAPSGGHPRTPDGPETPGGTDGAWLRSGDAGTTDADGYVFVVDR